MEHSLGRIPSPFDARDYNLKDFMPKGIWKTSAITEKNWEFLAEPLGQGDSQHCFPAGTLIRMADGSSKPIEEVRPLDYVITAEGNKKRVYGIMVRPFSGNLVTLNLMGHKHLSCTPEHLIFTKKGYIQAKDLIEGDLISIPKCSFDSNHPILFNDIVDRKEYSNKSNVGYITNTGSVPTIISPPRDSYEKTYGLGKLFGIYLAEGYGIHYGIKLAFHIDEEFTLVKETCELLKNEMGIDARLQYRSAHHTLIVTVGGKHWNLFFERLLGKGAENKRLHPLLCGNNEFRKGMLDGWIAGDGHCRRTNISGATVSKQLAHDMFCIANDLGLRPTIRMDIPGENRYAKKRLPRWTIEWGTIAVNKADDLSSTWRKIRNISEDGFDGFVYNLEVEEDHSYVAEGIGVHNCVGFSMANFGINLPVQDFYNNEIGHQFYYMCKEIDGEPNAENGSYVRSAAKVLKNIGRIDAYAFAPDISIIKWWLLNRGCLIVGTIWTDVMFTPNSDNIIDIGGTVVGGHAYLLNEWTKDNYIGIQNSWGSEWGVNGKAYISSANFDKIFRYGGEAMTAVELPLVANTSKKCWLVSLLGG